MVTVTQHQDTLNTKTCQAKLLTTCHSNRHTPRREGQLISIDTSNNGLQARDKQGLPPAPKRNHICPQRSERPLGDGVPVRPTNRLTAVWATFPRALARFEP